jgi:hypothetical protein
MPGVTFCWPPVLEVGPQLDVIEEEATYKNINDEKN